METFEVQAKQGLVKLPGGLQREIRIPSVFECKEVQEKMAAATGAGSIDVLVEFYISIGLEKDDLKHFGAADFNKFFLFLLGEKKS